MISGTGTNMTALLKDMANPNHPAEPVLVLSDCPEAKGLKVAKKMGVKSSCVDYKSLRNNREVFEETLISKLKQENVDLICLAGFKRILSEKFISHYENKILNIHPSILPLFKGLNTHQRAINSGMALHGATVHMVSKDLDSGRILGQTIIPILRNDDASSLKLRLLPAEHKLYKLVLRRFISRQIDPILVNK